MKLLSKKIRLFFWILKAIFQKHRKKIIASFLGGLIVFIVIIQMSPYLRGIWKINHEVVGLVGSYTPTSLPMSIQKLVSSGLTEISINGEVTPALATDWQITKDGKQYTFTLKNNLMWHDGKQFSAYDINYNLRDVEFTPLNDTTLAVKLKEPFIPLPSFLAKPLFRKGLIGLGSYRVETIKLKGEYVTYLKLTPLSPDLTTIEIKFYPSENLAKTAFKLGEVTALDEINDISTFESWKNLNIKESVKYNLYVGIFFNLDDKLMQAKELRQALAFAIEKNEKNRIATPISTESWAYTNRVKQYDKDEAAAKKLITGLKLNEDTTLTLSTFPQYFSLAQEISSAWEASGIKSKIKIEDTIPQEYQILLTAQEIPSDPDQYIFWHSTQKETNISHFANPKIDKLLEDGRKESDMEKRKKIYFDFQRYLVDETPAIFLFHPVSYTVSRKK